MHGPAEIPPSPHPSRNPPARSPLPAASACRTAAIRRRALAFGRGAALLALAASCGEDEDGPRAARSFRPNVLLISMDTTRADALGLYGGDRGASPVLDEFAQHSVVFEQAISPAPLTLPSHSTMLTGLDPNRHRARENSLFVLDDGAQTLAEALRDEGYHCFATVGAVILLSTSGIAQGFQDFDSGTISVSTDRRRAERPANEVVDAAIAALSRTEGPWFGFVHLYDPHQPFTAPREYASRYRSTDPLDQYYAEIAHADAQIGRLLEHLEKTGQRENTLVVFTSDHGEGRRQHGEVTHGSLVYDSTQHVPLLLSHPSFPPHRVATQVALCDVMATVLDLLGIDSEQPLDGRSLRPVLVDPSATLAQRPAWIESHSSALAFDWQPLEGVRTEDWKLIEGSRPHLFDLRHDPREEKDLAAEQPEKVEELRRTLEELRHRGPTLERSTRRLSAEDLKALGGIGYVEAVQDEVPESAAPRPDPMDHVADIERIELALNQMQANQFAAALPDLERLAVELPGTYQVQQALGNCLGRLGRAEASLTALRRAEAIHDHQPELQSSIAISLFLLERFDEAEKALAKAIALPGCPGRPYLMLDELYREKLGRPQDARKVLEALLASPDVSDAERAEARRKLGQ